MDTFGFFGDPQPWYKFCVPNVNFAESGPSVSTPVAYATYPSADLSNTTPLGSDSPPNSNPCVQIPAEYALPTDLGDESFWDGLPLLELEGPVEGHYLLPEPHVHQVENEGLLNVETNVVPPDVSRSSTSSRWQNFVWLIRACHRFSHAAAASLRAKVPEANINVFKGVMEKKGKFVCETRVMKKIQLEKKKIIKKVWLGTYQTQAEAARALDVGKYFFNAKETKTFFDPNIETMLSTLSQQLLAQPLDLLVVKVKQIAKYYGIHGTLP